MQNEFEKQVQQKMEELKLVPSDPVWQKVEMQIRKKKDRRRLIFWIPLLAILLGGSLWIGIDRYSNGVAYNRNNNEEKSRETENQNRLTQPGQPIVEQDINESNEKNLKTKSSVQPGKEIHSETAIKTQGIRLKVPPSEKAADAQPTQKNTSQKNNAKEEEKESSTKQNETVSTETQIEKSETVIGQVKENKQTDQKPNFPDSNTANIPSDKKIDSLVVTEKEIEANILKNDSLKTDSASTEKSNIKKVASSKWKPALTITAGFSGSGKLDVFNGFLSENKSMDYSAAPNAGSGPTNGMVYYPPSEVKKGFSFAAQAVVKKQLTNQIVFSAGLQYNYYSNSIQVGNRVLQSALFGNYSVAQYFSNNRNNYNNISWQSYRNHYHFVSLPSVLEWQLLKKHPLNLSTGLSFQYLVQTNGLIYDYNRQAYFHSKNAFNRLQLFSGLGLNYSFPVKNSSIGIGPELQYGISRLEKSNSNHHLFMYGLKAQLQLK